MCLETIQKMAYSEEYKLYKFLKDNCPKQVIIYFDENWHKN